jgi:uncharacterized protein YwqG
MTENPEVAKLREQLAETCANRVSPETASVVESVARPAIRLHHVDESSRSYLGGAALLDDPASWPRWHDRPLSLVAVVDLAELARLESDPRMPSSGVLNFFYDYEEQPWGFEPEHRGGWRVVLADPGTARPVSTPDGAEAFVSVGLAPQQTLSIPGWEEPAVEPVFPPHQDRSPAAEAVRQRYVSMQDDWNEVIGVESAPNHQVGGWPRLQQNPIWRECDAVSRGLPLGTSGQWRRAEPTFSVEREKDWRLLLQLDTDDDAGWMWGDVGTLYFAVRSSLPAPAVFEESWLVPQCG